MDLSSLLIALSFILGYFRCKILSFLDQEPVLPPPHHSVMVGSVEDGLDQDPSPLGSDWNLLVLNCWFIVASLRNSLLDLLFCSCFLIFHNFFM